MDRQDGTGRDVTSSSSQVDLRLEPPFCSLGGDGAALLVPGLPAAPETSMRTCDTSAKQPRPHFLRSPLRAGSSGKASSTQHQSKSPSFCCSPARREWISLAEGRKSNQLLSHRLPVSFPAASTGFGDETQIQGTHCSFYSVSLGGLQTAREILFGGIGSSCL